MTTRRQSSTPTMADVIKVAIDSRISDLHVALPGKIDKYDAAKQKADVKPLVKRRLVAVDGTELDPEALPVISDVPIIFPRSSKFFISFPLAPGDHVLLVFNERSIDNFLIGKVGDDSDPDDYIMHDLNDAVAFPGFWPFAAALTQADESNLVLGQDSGIQVHLTPSGTVEIKQGGGTATFSLAIAEKLQTLYATAKIAHDTHAHPTGTGPSGIPTTTFPEWDSSIASVKGKVED